MTVHSRGLRYALAFAITAMTAGSLLDLEAARPFATDDQILRGDAHMRDFNFEVMRDPPPANGSAHFGAIRRVYVAGKQDAPPLLVLHELPGLREADIDLGARLSRQFLVT